MVFIGEYDNISKGEEEIYNRFPYKKQGILTQFSHSKTLDGAKKIAKTHPLNPATKCFVIYDKPKDKYLIYF